MTSIAMARVILAAHEGEGIDEAAMRLLEELRDRRLDMRRARAGEQFLDRSRAVYKHIDSDQLFRFDAARRRLGN